MKKFLLLLVAVLGRGFSLHVFAAGTDDFVFTIDTTRGNDTTYTPL